MAGRPARSLPRPFTLHWGSGRIVEEATYMGRYHEPSIQLLEFEDGSLALRSCYYDHAGRFQGSPLILGDDEIGGLREALASTPHLRALLEELVGCR
jgi:hypothetical protein